MLHLLWSYEAHHSRPRGLQPRPAVPERGFFAEMFVAAFDLAGAALADIAASALCRKTFRHRMNYVGHATNLRTGAGQLSYTPKPLWEMKFSSSAAVR